MRRPGNYPGETILYMFQDVLEGNIMINGIAIVKSTANKFCNSFGNSKRDIPVNTTKVRNVIKAAMTSL